MTRVGQLLNSLVVSGTNNFRALAEIANILDSGIPGEIIEKEADKDAGNMDSETVQPDKLAK